MAKRKNGKKDKEDSNSYKKPERLQEETMSWILAIVFFVLFIFFSLSAMSKAGVVGVYVYKIFSMLFGLGYYLIPTLFVALSVSSAMSIKKSFGATRFIGSILFFGSSLALLELALSDRGGFVGGLLEKPLVKLFDVYASAIILSGVAIIGVLTIFDTPINILGLFRRKEINPEDTKETQMNIRGVVEDNQAKDPQPIQQQKVEVAKKD